MTTDQGMQTDLLAAAKALREDRLVEPKGTSAMALFQKVLAKDPDSEGAQRGMELVAQELITRAWTQLRGMDLLGAAQAMADAELAGAPAESLELLREEIAHQNLLANARLGRVELTLPISQLKTLRRSDPVFPKRAEAAQLEGWVEVEFVVSPSGDVVDTKILKSSDAVFDSAALDALNSWRFKPHMDDSRAVPVRSAVRFTFRR